MSSFAKNLSDSPLNAASPRAEFNNARGEEPAPKCESSMVRNDRPKPVPRPSPDIADTVDRSAFNARWDAEIKATEQTRATSETREVRMAVFKEKRMSQQKMTRSKKITRNFNR